MFRSLQAPVWAEPKGIVKNIDGMSQQFLAGYKSAKKRWRERECIFYNRFYGEDTISILCGMF